jgi:hypothetical protein
MGYGGKKNYGRNPKFHKTAKLYVVFVDDKGNKREDKCNDYLEGSYVRTAFLNNPNYVHYFRKDKPDNLITREDLFGDPNWKPPGISDDQMDDILDDL